MHAPGISFLVFALVVGGAFAGMVVRRARPDEHFNSEAKDTIRLAIGLVVTMTSLVLGMLVSSGKTYYDGQKTEVAELSAEAMFINGLLTAYGTETQTQPLRVEARNFIQGLVDQIWPDDRSQPGKLKPLGNNQTFYQHLELLTPTNPGQVAIKAELLTATLTLRKSYWFMFLKSEQPAMSFSLLAVVTSWLVIIFFSFGLFAPRTPNVILMLIVCALAVSAAIFIIVSLNSPFSGVMRISPAAVRDVLDQMALGQ